ncbi:MAG TPA: TRAP transporter small permease [Candidatus Brevibacterium intestinigallinarum]|nr:TRAP transporter small permease [Candidatus Brevibacterium intestinigallinarum]
MLTAFSALRSVTQWLRALSGIVILAVMLITGYDVVMRYIFARPLDWSITISMVGLVTIVLLTVPDLEARGQHIDMDLFYRGFGPRKKLIADVVTVVATSVFCLVSGVTAAVTAVHFLTADLRTAGTFNLPIWIGYALVALGLLLAAVMTVLRFILTRQGHLESEGGAHA